MISLSKKTVFPAGIDLTDSHLKVSQLGVNSSGLYLSAAAIEARPDDVEFGSGHWQRWVVAATKKIFFCNLT